MNRIPAAVLRRRSRRLRALALALGLSAVPAIAVGAHVVAPPAPMGGDAARTFAQALAAHPDVLYAEPDHRVHPRKFVNDEYIAAQTYLDVDADGGHVAAGRRFFFAAGVAATAAPPRGRAFGGALAAGAAGAAFAVAVLRRPVPVGA